MGARSSEQVKRELESERDRLEDAVGALRSQARSVRRKLPLVALAATGAGFALRLAAARVFRRQASGMEKRARFSFLGRD